MGKKKKKRTSSKSGKKGKQAFWKDPNTRIGLLLVLAITCIALIPSLSNEFVNWDDDVNLLENPNLDGFTWDNIRGIFTSHVIGNYNPLPIFTFAVEKALFGLNPTVYHINNLLLHLLCVFFVYRIVLSMRLPVEAAVLTALLFGIHPMRVESVAWVTERKDVLFGVFYLAALWYYIRYRWHEKEKKYWFIILGLFALSLLSKIQAVALPLSMLAVDYYFKRPLKWKLIWEKIPFFAGSLLFGLIGIYFLQEQGSFEDKTNFNMIQRLVLGAYSYMVYVVKWIFPYELSPVYPYPARFPSAYYFAVPPFLALIGYLVYLFRKRNRPVVFGFAFFTFNIMFLLQIRSAGQGFLADRFTYIAYFGLFFLMGYYFNYLLNQRPKWRQGLIGVAVMYLLVLSVITWRQNKVWESGETLWSAVLEYDANSPLPYGNRGNYYRDNKQFEKAKSDYTNAIRLKPDEPSYHNSLGKLYFDSGRPRESIENFTKAIQLKGDRAEYYINRGNALASLGQYEQALRDFNKGLELKPNSLDGYMGRSLLYISNGKYAEALEDYNAILEKKPNDPEIYYERSIAKHRLNQLQSALQDVNKAIRLKPQSGIYYIGRAQIYADMGQITQARQDANHAKRAGVQIPADLLQKIQ